MWFRALRFVSRVRGNGLGFFSALWTWDLEEEEEDQTAFKSRVDTWYLRARSRYMKVGKLLLTS
jgi:hypothetical protein